MLIFQLYLFLRLLYLPKMNCCEKQNDAKQSSSSSFKHRSTSFVIEYHSDSWKDFFVVRKRELLWIFILAYCSQNLSLSPYPKHTFCDYVYILLKICLTWSTPTIGLLYSNLRYASIDPYLSYISRETCIRYGSIYGTSKHCY